MPTPTTDELPGSTDVSPFPTFVSVIRIGYPTFKSLAKP